MGMADHLAFAISMYYVKLMFHYYFRILLFLIGSAGYFACKYMPYGPVQEVLPYLARRANENRGMLQGPVRERRILADEIKRRISGRT